MVALWAEYLNRDNTALSDFLAELNKLELEQVVKMMSDPWEMVLEARGAKKMLALLQRMATLKQREEESHARYSRQAQGR
jgi:hypothetical protein